ncbi:phage replisome organizer N-terminal domain-containing protein [Granulicatella adiacens]|uniref:phage replisome organizer N-terminal domain-containing protein n=1 Tax=Granulicatella adiacens TaxID=46124 RepID=UPI0021D82718|nr:phage replisome organizer N-terminal domain-containing protein [Granulicatella adiacens]UXY41090.1 phage replisome organizer N-terminal domain-containing protein [Granulicatella adiacens]
MAEKMYYWLKLHKDFFERKEVKLLRMTEKGELSVIIYEKMLLNALETDGVIYFEHLTETFEEELALALNEDVESVRTVIQFLTKKNLLTSVDDGFYIETFSEMVGKESTSTERVRKYRQRKKEETEKMLHETNETLHVTNCNTEKRKRREE